MLQSTVAASAKLTVISRRAAILHLAQIALALACIFFVFFFVLGSEIAIGKWQIYLAMHDNHCHMAG